MPEADTTTDLNQNYSAPNNSDVPKMPLARIVPSPLNPRRHFDEAKLTQLTNSIRMFGVQEPITVRPPQGDSDLYQIVMGERRWRAAKMADLHEIPVIVRDMDDAELAERALTENLQRAELNCVEEAHGYQNVLELNKSLTQVTLAQRLSISQPHISNSLRLLRLPLSVQTLLAEDKISRSHGLELASIAKEAPDEAERLARKAWQEDWSQDVLKAAVKEVEAKAKETAQPTLELSEPATPKYVHTPNPAASAAVPPVVAEKVTTTETTKTETLSAAGTVIPPAPANASAPSPAPSAPPQDGLHKEASQAVADAAQAVTQETPAPVTPQSAPPETTPEADVTSNATSQPTDESDVITTVPSGPRVATSISGADDDYLFEAGLTLDQLFAKYRKLAENPFALSSNAIKYLKALTDNYNEKHPDTLLSPMTYLEFVLASEAQEAGFDINVLKAMPE